MSNAPQDKTPSIVLGIPGQWKDRAEFLKSIVQTSDFLFAADVLYHPASKRAISVDLYPPDPKLERAFQIASGSRIPPAELRAIAQHTMTAYLIGPGGSLENAGFMVRAASALLKAGGLAVKVESAGIAHSRESWLKLEDAEPLIYGPDTFVVFVVGSSTYSCGMHNLGFRDALFQSSPRDAVEMLRLFLRYSISPDTPLSDRDTVALGTVIYRMYRQPCAAFAPDSHFHNPYGVWSLERASP